MGFGLSSFIIGKVFAAVTPSDGTDKWQETFRILGIIIVVVMVICSFFFVKTGKLVTIRVLHLLRKKQYVSRLVK